MREVVERVEQQPRPEARLLAHERAGRGDPPPDDGAAVRLGPHRDDAGRRIPAPQPFVFDQATLLSLRYRRRAFRFLLFFGAAAGVGSALRNSVIFFVEITVLLKVFLASKIA